MADRHTHRMLQKTKVFDTQLSHHHRNMKDLFPVFALFTSSSVETRGFSILREGESLLCFTASSFAYAQIALTSNKPGFRSVLVNGRPVKSINQYYNKRKAELQKKLVLTGTTKRMERMTNKRNRRIDHYMYTASKRIIDLLVKERICIGKNDAWKQQVNMGKRTNQNFVQIPYACFIQMLTYKAELLEITVKVKEDSYTSKASLLDLDPLPVRDPNNGGEKHTFKGRAKSREASGQ